MTKAWQAQKRNSMGLIGEIGRIGSYLSYLSYHFVFLGNQILHDPSMDICQAEVTAVEAIGEAFMV